MLKYKQSFFGSSEVKFDRELLAIASNLVRTSSNLSDSYKKDSVDVSGKISQNIAYDKLSPKKVQTLREDMENFCGGSCAILEALN